MRVGPLHTPLFTGKESPKDSILTLILLSLHTYIFLMTCTYMYYILYILYIYDVWHLQSLNNNLMCVSAEKQTTLIREQRFHEEQ